MVDSPQSYYEGANERIIARIPGDAQRILDVGCAAGKLGEIVKRQRGLGQAARAPQVEVWGIELVPEVAADAKARLDHILVGDIEQMDPLPLPERYFDCMICGDVLEHLRDPERVLRRMRRHLAPEATVIANVPNIAHWSVLVQLLQGQFNYEDKGLLDRTHVHFFTPLSFKDTLWEAGYLVTDEDALMLPDGGASKAIGQAAQALGLDGAVAERNAATYQHLYVAKPIPDPYTEPEKMAALVGPHIGQLGPATKRCSVVVLTYNSMKTIETCLNSVLPTLGPDDELILVDNASQDGTDKYLQNLPANRAIGNQKSAIKLILNNDNCGFSKGCNIGILQSSGETTILLNPDTQVWPGWIEGLIAPFADLEVAAVGPLSDNVCGDQSIGHYLRPDQITSPDAIAAIVNPALSAANGQPPTANTKLLIGFCVALKRVMLDKFGLLEEACFLGADDLEISWRLGALGYRLVVAKGTFVAHSCGASFESIQDQKIESVSISDRALTQKLANYYGAASLPSSGALWGSDIFEAAFASECGHQLIHAGAIEYSNRSTLRGWRDKNKNFLGNCYQLMPGNRRRRHD